MASSSTSPPGEIGISIPRSSESALAITVTFGEDVGGFEIVYFFSSFLIVPMRPSTVRTS